MIALELAGSAMYDQYGFLMGFSLMVRCCFLCYIFVFLTVDFSEN